MPAEWRRLVAELGLQPHPEGGYYRETFRAGRRVSVDGDMRAAATSIYYLLAEGACSAWHRIDADEVWYFHAGGPLEIHVLTADGDLVTHRLGNPVTHVGATCQAVVPAGCWFSAELAQAGDYALVGCAVAPGFEFGGFELARLDDIQPALSRHGDWVLRLLAGAR